MIKKFFLLVILSTLIACGGGGGGGSDSSDNNTSTGGDRGFRILHGILDMEPADLKLADATVVTGSEFAKSWRYFKLPEGTQALSVYRRGDAVNPVSSENFTVDAKGKYSYLLFGNRSALGIGGRILNDGFVGEIPSGQVALRVIHATVGASEINYLVNQVPSGTLGFSRDSGYQLSSLNANSEVSFSATRAVDSRLIVSQNLSLEEGKAYTLLVTGELGLYTLVRVYQD